MMLLEKGLTNKKRRTKRILGREEQEESSRTVQEMNDIWKRKEKDC
jgi:hypothetical protein